MSWSSRRNEKKKYITIFLYVGYISITFLVVESVRNTAPQNCHIVIIKSENSIFEKIFATTDDRILTYRLPWMSFINDVQWSRVLSKPEEFRLGQVLFNLRKEEWCHRWSFAYDPLICPKEGSDKIIKVQGYRVAWLYRLYHLINSKTNILFVYLFDTGWNHPLLLTIRTFYRDNGNKMMFLNFDNSYTQRHIFLKETKNFQLTFESSCRTVSKIMGIICKLKNCSYIIQPYACIHKI